MRNSLAALSLAKHNCKRSDRTPPTHIPHPQLAHTRIEGVKVNHSR
ncbi:MAG: hypothetical protein QQW96_13890 [Tychonema bourrellyi B0820]|nr:hypothetical protein [Tychonema bourrellyi B0820]